MTADKHVKKRGGVWEILYFSGYKGNKAFFKLVQAPSLAQAQHRVHMLEKEGARANGMPLLYNDMLAIWLENTKLGLRESSYIKYRYMVEKHIAPELGQKLVRDIDISVINRFLAQKKEAGRLNDGGPLSASYVGTLAYIIRTSLDMATNMKLRDTLVGKIARPSVKRQELQVLTVAEQAKLEAFLREKKEDKRLAVLLCLYTGLRIGEVCALRWSNIDFEQGILQVRGSVKRSSPQPGGPSRLVVEEPKTATSLRDIPLQADILALLRSYSSNATGEFLVAGNRYSCADPRTLQYNYAAYLEKCGLRKLNFHALRHTFATRCIEVGMDIKTLSEILGHASVNITLSTYVHSSIELKRKQMERLGGIYENGQQ